MLFLISVLTSEKKKKYLRKYHKLFKVRYGFSKLISTTIYIRFWICIDKFISTSRSIHFVNKYQGEIVGRTKSVEGGNYIA